MKNLYIINEFVTSLSNGIGTYVNELINCLSDTNVKIGILLFNSEKKFFCIEEINKVTYFHFPVFTQGFLQENFKIVDNFLQLYIPDSSNNIFMFNYSPCSLLMKSLKKTYPLSKQIYVIHDMFWALHLYGNVEAYINILQNKNHDNIKEEFAYLLDSYEEEKNMCDLADYIVCLSNDTYHLLIDQYLVHIDKVRLIPNALTGLKSIWSKSKKETFRQEMLLNKNEKVILYVGRVSELKGFYAYILAFKEVVKNYPKCRLVVVGSAKNWDHILEYCYPISSNITFTGVLSPDELDKWYQIADIGIQPSYTEQCSYVGLEMMAHKLPIIASDGFGVRCMFKKNENALIASIGNIELIDEFKNQLIYSTLKLLYSHSECKKLGNSAKEILKLNYSMSETKKQYKALFEE